MTVPLSTPPVALTIAGSDSGGGAGIQADLATFATFGVHGCSAITALTAQNTVGVQDVHLPPVAFLEAQLTSVLEDLPVAAVKTGMLGNAEVVEAVARWAAAGRLPGLVVDPVLVSTTGARLLESDAERLYVDLLFPHALVVTPNTREAEVLTGRTLDTLADRRAAAAELAATGPACVVITGGHLAGDAIDVVHHRGTTIDLRSDRIPTDHDHGTGCTFSAAVAAGLARGEPVDDAIAAAKAFVTAGLERAAGWKLGAGHGTLDRISVHGASLLEDRR